MQRSLALSIEPHAIMSDLRLRIFLNDHLSGAVAAVELAKRTRDENDDETALYDFLDTLADDFEHDRETLEDLLDRIDEPQNPLKIGAAYLAERTGRFKPNDQLTGYSPLSRLVELEGLLFMLEGFRVLWRTLAVVAEDDDRIDDYDFDERARRVQRRQHRLDAFRERAVRIAFLDEDDDFEDVPATGSVRTVEREGEVKMIVVEKG